VHILQLVTFRSSKDETEGVVFDRILKLLVATGYNPEKIRFRFEDRPFGIKKTSAIDRAVKAYPELAPFQAEVIEQWNNNQRLTVLSNFEKEREIRSVPASPTCVPAGVLSEVMHGIPRRFPFWLAEIVFDDIAALNRTEPTLFSGNDTLAHRGLTGPGLTAESRWWRSGRLRSLEAIATAVVSKDGQRLILPDTAEALLSHVGKIIHRGLKVTPDASQAAEFERQASAAAAVAQRYERNPFAGAPATEHYEANPSAEAPATNILYLLPDPGESMGIPLIERRAAEIPSIKELLKAEFKPMGYRYKSSLSGRGTYTLHKKGPQNYVFEVFVDVSPIGGQFCGRFGVTSPQGFFAVRLQLPPFGHDYPVNEHLPAVVKNTAFVVQKLEGTYVPELEAILGAAPPWFPAASVGK
jgi:hypothetical protein